MTLFSVIIPNYNHAPFLRQRLDSVLNQTNKNFEIIILDDCSTDSSRQIIETYRGNEKISHIIYNEKNSGSPFTQWKKGIELAMGNWIWVAESDDFANLLFLEEASEAIQRFPSLGIFYCDSLVVDENNKSFSERFSERKNRIFSTSKWSNYYQASGIDEINEYLKFDCTINNISSVIFQKCLFTNNAKVINGFRYYGDWFFILKACFGSNIFYSPQPLNCYRKHSRSYLNSETSIVISRSEYFKILQMLYNAENVTGKKRLLYHFAYNYLGFGLMQDGVKSGWHIVRSYLKTDRSLAYKVLLKIMIIKLLRKKRAFYVSGKNAV